ncbi:hypothetical protein [Streptomyces sp. NPDC059928]|uniref:hypothetical protein n=1 Tax=unclassified Streptomyces TaxID=2593676 RepID=UPI0036550846
MPIIGPGPDDPENDNWDPAWESQDTSFRRWLYEKLTSNGWKHTPAADAASIYAPANRYRGLSPFGLETIATLIHTTVDAVQAAHKADLAEWAREQQLRDHPDLAVLDADLNRVARRN